MYIAPHHHDSISWGLGGLGFLTTSVGVGLVPAQIIPTGEAEMNSATTQIMYAAFSPQFNHVGAGLVPALKARMNLATGARARGEDEPRHYSNIYGTSSR